MLNLLCDSIHRAVSRGNKNGMLDNAFKGKKQFNWNFIEKKNEHMQSMFKPIGSMIVLELIKFF